MGAGIAKEFEKRFNLREKLLFYDGEERAYPTCILENNVFNLITKGCYYNKPTYETLIGALEKMKEIIVDEEIKYVAILEIGCGLDKLNWDKIKTHINQVFEGLDLEILVCSI